MSDPLKKAYEAAQRAKRKPATKASKKTSKTTVKRKRASSPKLTYSQEVDIAVARLLGQPIRHGEGSPGINEAAIVAIMKRKPRKKASKKSTVKRTTKRSKTTKRVAKTSRSRRPGESFKSHMARLRKVDGPRKRKPSKKSSKKSTVKRTTKRSKTTKRVAKTSRSRRPGENFKQHMARLRKLDGR